MSQFYIIHQVSRVYKDPIVSRKDRFEGIAMNDRDKY